MRKNTTAPDLNQLAALIVGAATAEKPRKRKKKNQHAVAMARARAKSLTSEQRREIAQKAARTRWANRFKNDHSS
jgi:hypothetical protein